MANFANLKAAINAVIKQNGQGEITGEVMNQVLTAMVNSLGSNYQFAGVATPSTNPGTPDQNVFYMATQAGTYTNFSAIVLQAGISILLWDGSWTSETFFTVDSEPTAGSNNFITSGAVFDKMKLDGGTYDVTAHNNNATFADLSALLNSENLNTLIPDAVRHGGMSIKFVQSSDNKYVQYHLTKNVWSTDVEDWDEYASSELNNVVESIIAETENLIVFQDKTTVVNNVSVTTDIKGNLHLNGTANSSGGRTTQICKPFLLSAGTYRLVTNDAVVYLEKASDNTIVANNASPLFILDTDTNVYIGVNVVNGTQYNSNKTVAIFSGQEDKDFIPAISAYDIVARKKINEGLFDILSRLLNTTSTKVLPSVDSSYIGKYINADGDVASAQAYRISEPITLPANSQIIFAGIGVASTSCIFATKDITTNEYIPLVIADYTGKKTYTYTNLTGYAITIYISTNSNSFYNKYEIRNLGLLSGIGDLSSLKTTVKSTLVNAINEIVDNEDNYVEKEKVTPTQYADFVQESLLYNSVTNYTSLSIEEQEIDVTASSSVFVTVKFALPSTLENGKQYKIRFKTNRSLPNSTLNLHQAVNPQGGDTGPVYASMTIGEDNNYSATFTMAQYVYWNIYLDRYDIGTNTILKITDISIILASESEYERVPLTLLHDINLDNLSQELVDLIENGYIDNPTTYRNGDARIFNKGLCVGDSLTAGTFNYRQGGTTANYVNIPKYSYPTKLSEIMGIDITNAGQGGMTSAEWYDYYKSTTLTGYDFAIIQLGVNDYSRYSGWTQTSIDAFNNIIDKLQAENTNIKIFVATIIPATSYGGRESISQGIRELVASRQDENVILLDMAVYSKVGESTAYNCGHLSAYGYWLIAQEYFNFMSWYINHNKSVFREVQFIDTNYHYEE